MKDRLEVASLNHPHCLVSKSLAEFSDSVAAVELDLVVKSVPSFKSGLKRLSGGEFDLLAVPARSLHGHQMAVLEARCSVVAARSPRRTAQVLVSENRLWYQPKAAIILAESQVVRRQLRRARRGIRVLAPTSYAGIHGLDAPPSDALKQARWMEDLRGSGAIDAYVTSRDVYDSLRPDERRHALGVDPQERGGEHFLPVAYSDLVIFIARVGFPSRLAELVTELEGQTAWWVQDHMLGSMTADEVDKVGILVRHQQVGVIMRKAEEFLDLVVESAFHDPYGEVPDTEVHVEIRMEILSNDGRHTLSLERLVPYSDYEPATIAVLQDWDLMMANATVALADHSREGPAADAWIDLDE